MDLKTLTYIVVFSSFALYFGIAWWARAASTSEFYVAGGGVHPVLNGMATAADWMKCRVIHLDGWFNRVLRLRWICIPNGLDRWLCTVGDVTGSLLA